MLVSAVRFSPWAPLISLYIEIIGVFIKWDNFVLVLSFLVPFQRILSKSFPAYNFRLAGHFFQRIPSTHSHYFVVAMAIFRKPNGC